MRLLKLYKVDTVYFGIVKFFAMKKDTTVSVSSRSLLILRCSIGVIYCWFGILKFFKGYSPAEEIAITTMQQLTGGLLPGVTSLLLLAIWETVVGILLITGWQIRAVVVMLILHLLCTFSHFYFFPGTDFKWQAEGFTLVGQYILKNSILLSAAWVLWQTNPPNKFREACYSIE